MKLCEMRPEALDRIFWPYNGDNHTRRNTDMTKHDLIKAVRERMYYSEECLFWKVIPEGDYGFVITRCGDSTESLRRYHVMEGTDLSGHRHYDVVEIDSVSWIEDWNFYHDEAVQ